MGLLLVMVVALVGGVWGEDSPATRAVPRRVYSVDNPLENTDLLLAFVIFRHGDRTPDQEELDLYPSETHLDDNIFFPYGKKALTNKGKQRSYLVGKYLRERYDGFISRLYLPDEIVIRTTDYARTQMTALAALSALYPPPTPQKWNPNLEWQPIPYNTPPFDRDDLLYWYNCPKYLMMRDKSYDLPAVKAKLEQFESLFPYLTKNSGRNITKPEDIFFLDNLFQTLHNVGVEPPKWAQEVMPQIKGVTKLEYTIQFHNADLTKLASGVLMHSILNTTNLYLQGDVDRPKLYLYSAHENNVAALMAVARVFQSHQPKYGATFSLELRRKRDTGDVGITAVYAGEAGGPGEILPVSGCGGQLFCEYDKFIALVQDETWTQEDMDKVCKSPL